jgi:hypothetical protein
MLRRHSHDSRLRWTQLFIQLKSNPKEFLPNEFPSLLHSFSSNICDCSFVQFLSRCLKLSRQASHPERKVGRSTELLPNEDGDVIRKICIGITMELTEHIPTVIKSLNGLPDYHIYFVLILLKDYLKESVLPSSIHSPTFSDIVPIIAEGLSALDDALTYRPVAGKTSEVFMLLLSSRFSSVLRPLPLRIRLIGAVIAWIVKVGDRSCRETHAISCAATDFPALVGRERGLDATFMITPFTVALNETLKLRLEAAASASGCSMADSTTLDRDAHSLRLFFEEYISRRPIDAYILELSSSDAEVVKFLLNVVELFLRLEEVIKSLQGDSDSDKLQIYNGLREVIVRYGFEPASTFVIFIEIVLCFDPLVLVDLVSNNETVALEYTIRIVKYINLRRDLFRDILINSQQQQCYAIKASARQFIRFLRSFRDKLIKLNDSRVLPFRPQKICDLLNEEYLQFFEFAQTSKKSPKIKNK